MWSASYSVLDTIVYIRDTIYSELPASLWNRNLWMYGWIEDWTSGYFSPQWKGRTFDIYINRNGMIQTGLALVRGNNQTETMDVLVDVESAEDVVSLYDFIGNKYKWNLVVTVRSKELAERISEKILNLVVEPSKVKLYATNKVKLPSLSIELTTSHQNRIWQKQWSSFSDMLVDGFRFFGVEVDEKVVTTAGLWHHTYDHIEIVAVGTDPRYMRKGYAKEACSLALNEGLNMAKVVTWSTSITNTASWELAKSLGFKEYLTTYHIKKA